MRRVPIQLRLAAGFALAMALVLASAGAFLYVSLGADLARALDQDLRLRAQDLSTLVRGPGGSLAAESGGRIVERGESFAELLGPGGSVLDATRPLEGRALLGETEIRSALKRQLFLDRSAVPGLNEPARLLATPLDRHGRRVVLVVGATRENRAEALRSLRTKLLIAGPIALLLSTGLGYLLAGGGLRVVEAMRRRAAEISAARPGERLPVPPTGDQLERLGHTLNEMLERLEAALERERGFVAEAGHELRTPLALLRAELDFALHHAETEQERRDALNTASDETDRIIQLAGDLLLIASSDQGKLPLRTERVSARELLESVHNRFAGRARGAARQLEIDASSGLILSCDRLRLEQALGNLVENALRYGDGSVRIETRLADGEVEFHVRDKGSGFPPEFLPHAFDRFSRADHNRTSDGAGLGLAIVGAIARAHGGSVKATNSTEGGTDVWITMPQAPSQ